MNNYVAVQQLLSECYGDAQNLCRQPDKMFANMTAQPKSWVVTMSESFLDCIGVPEFFVTTVAKVECAGDGCIRTYVCAERGGILVPQYMAIMPIASMIRANKYVQTHALEIYQRTMSDMMVH